MLFYVISGSVVRPWQGSHRCG